MARRSRVDPNKYPKGLTAAKVQKILDHYENQTEAEAIAEAGRPPRRGSTMMEVPTAILPDVLKLIGKHEKSKRVAKARTKRPR